MSLVKFFSTVDEDFVRENFKDGGEAEKFITRYRNKAKLPIGMMISFVLVLFIAIGYAVVKIESTKVEEAKVTQVQEQIDQCAISSKQQLADANIARAQAEKVNREVQALLEKCFKTKNAK